MRSSHRPRPKQANDVVARSWPRCLSWPQPAAPGTPLGPLMPIGQQQHTQHVAEARSALARGAMMASRRRCAIVHATPGLPRRQAALCSALPWPELFFSARDLRPYARQLSIDRASIAHCSEGCVEAVLLRGKYAATKDARENNCHEKRAVTHKSLVQDEHRPVDTETPRSDPTSARARVLVGGSVSRRSKPGSVLSTEITPHL